MTSGDRLGIISLSYFVVANVWFASKQHVVGLIFIILALLAINKAVKEDLL